MRLDRRDSYLTRFPARVVEVSRDDKGSWLRLDRSAFYPTAGGQPHDTGSLNGVPVTAVEARAGHVWHLIEGDVSFEAGAEIIGEVDWPRRFAHMQRHSAQHLLSQALMRVGADRGAEAEGVPGFATRSVSMRGPDCTLDVTGEPDEEAIAAAEAEVNRAARAALPVLAFEVEDSHLGSYRLRRPAKVSGLVRLVAMGDYDLVACGGTHVRNTAEVLPVKLVGSERVRGGLTRLTFRAGDEAISDHALKHDVISTLTTLLSAPVDGLVERVTARSERIQGLELVAREAVRGRAENLATVLLARAEAALAGGGRLIAHVVDDEEIFDALIERLQREPRCVTLLGIRSDSGAKLAFLAGPDTDADVRPVLNAALAVIGGRGGGRPDRARGAGPHADRLQEALGTAVDALLGT